MLLVDVLSASVAKTRHGIAVNAKPTIKSKLSNTDRILLDVFIFFPPV
jgi:hypothetical protein